MSIDPNLDEILALAERALPGSGIPLVHRVKSGASTPVYRIHRAGTTHYLRLAEGPEATLAPEVHVHEMLRSRGARVPEVVFFDPFNQRLQRSVMVTTEFPGEPLRANFPGSDVSAVLEAAGRDLALINAVEVSGFGWIRRNRPDIDRLEAELPTMRAFALGDVESHLSQLPGCLSARELDAIRNVVACSNELFDSDVAFLAHGDFDVTHIYHHNGQYTGIIDFGEIRGTDRFYDLGHFALHDGETNPDSLMPSLLDGYREVAGLPPDHDRHIQIWSLLIGIRAVARSIERPRTSYQEHLIVAVRRALAALQI